MLNEILSLSNGARYYKADLHVHTPEDPERYERRDEVSPADIVEGAKAAEVEIIAVTDHNQFTSVDEVVKASETRGVIVFPGVELTTPGGKPHVHILVIFDRDVDGEIVKDFIRQAGIQLDKIGTTQAVTGETVFSVLNMDYEHSRISIAPHVLSSSGLFKAAAGETRIQAYRAKTLLAVEIPDESSQFDMVRQICEGRDPNYGPKRCAMIRSSDARSPEEIGSRYTWLKMSDPPSLEGLRQAFLDYESRVRFDKPTASFPRIVGMAVDGQGFLGQRNGQPGVRVHFNPYLNCIIGGKGTGKSAIIEVMRYALGTEPRLPKTKERIAGLIDAALGPGGKVTLFLEVNGQNYRVSRVLDAEPQVFAAGDMELLPIAPGWLFQAQFYGQQEILDVAEEYAFQLDMLDRFIAGKLQSSLDRKRELELELEDNLSTILRLDQQIELGEEKRERLAWIEEKLRYFRRAGIEQLMTTMKGYQIEQAFFTRLLEDFDQVVESLDESATTIPDPSHLVSEEVLKTLPNEALVRRCRTHFATCLASVREHLMAQKETLLAFRAQVEEWRREEWTPLYRSQEEEYAERLQELQAQGITQPDDYLKLESEKSTLESLMQEVERLKQQRGKELSRREELLDEWEAVRYAIYKARKGQAAKLTKQLAAKVRVRVTHAGAHAALRDCLTEVFGETDVEAKTLYQVADHCASPQEVARLLGSLRDDAGAYSSSLLAVIGLDEGADREHPTVQILTEALDDEGLNWLRGWSWGKREQKRDARESFYEYLRDIYRGSGIYGSVLQKVVDHFRTPRKLAAELLRCRAGRTENPNVLDCLNLSDAAMGTLVNYLDRQALLELQTFELADQPHIELVVDGKPRSIFELSIGQKCTAILTLLLVESDIPLIVDQPEDSLDNKFIYEEVVQLLRQEKEGRQFIIATHNANIPVLGDAELILALEAGEDRGWVEQRDALDNLAVQEAAKKILEGGREAFERRREKYGF
jgi:hypothetical protein